MGDLLIENVPSVTLVEAVPEIALHPGITALEDTKNDSDSE